MKEKELERILKALANHRRLAILCFLKRHKEAPVGDIAEEIHLSLKSTSKHLTILAAAGMLDREQRGLLMFYYLRSGMPNIAKKVVAVL
jgi:ArsR family transcriptional regulator, arsenate/arsenite/antimonite-responsive transcriptional repressor